MDGRLSSLFWAELPLPTGNQTYKHLVDSYDFVNEPLLPAKVRSAQKAVFYGMTEWEHGGGLCDQLQVEQYCADHEEVRGRWVSLLSASKCMTAAD